MSTTVILLFFALPLAVFLAGLFTGLRLTRPPRISVSRMLASGPSWESARTEHEGAEQ